MKKLLSLLVSIAILAVVYATLDVTAIRDVLRGADLSLLGGSLLLLLMLVMLSALRLVVLARTAGFQLDMRSAIQATFAANALNIFLPGKLGDILKAALMAERDSQRLERATSLVVWEKLSDFVALFFMAAVPLFFLGSNLWGVMLLGAFGALGLAVLLVPRATGLLFKRVPFTRRITNEWEGLLTSLRSRPRGLIACLVLTSIAWLGHLCQISLMAASIGVSGDAGFWSGFMALMPVAIVAGLVPLTFSGVGTRDAALVVLYGTQIGPELAAALGVLFWLRYLVPGLVGSPLLPKFLIVTAEHRRRLMDKTVEPNDLATK